MFLKFPRISVLDVVRRRVPIVGWLPKYGVAQGVSDFVAGLTVGLTLLPQAIAYAALAGLGPQYGLYASFAGSFVYIIFGTVKEVNIGPTALLSLLTFTYTKDTNSDFAVLLCFLSGIVELLCGILHLGFLVEFVSVPVTAGFCSATAIIIASSQVKGLLGIKVKSEGFFETWSAIIEHVDETRPWDLTLSIVCCAFLLGMRKLKDVTYDKTMSQPRQVFGKCLWLLSTARNALVVLACSGLAYWVSRHGHSPLILTGKIESGLPVVGLPPFGTTSDNTTYTFLDMCSHLGSGILVVPLVSLLGNIAIAKAFSSGEIVDATQEMITLGLCNIVGSFFRSMPVSGSFSRSAVNNASGVQTPLGGLYTGSLIILALAFLTPYFYFIPKATLSSVIICAVLFMVEVQLVRLMWRTSKKDLLPAFVSFLLCLWKGVEIGILCGVAVDLMYLLFVNARPKCRIERIVGPYTREHIVIQPSNGLLFPTVDYIRTKIAKSTMDSKEPIVVDCAHVAAIDFTGIQGRITFLLFHSNNGFSVWDPMHVRAAQPPLMFCQVKETIVDSGLKALVDDMKRSDRLLIFHNVSEGLTQSLNSSIGPDFVSASTSMALTQLIKGIQDVQINVDDLLESKGETIELRERAPEENEAER